MLIEQVNQRFRIFIIGFGRNGNARPPEVVDFSKMKVCHQQSPPSREPKCPLPQQLDCFTKKINLHKWPNQHMTKLPN